MRDRFSTLAWVALLLGAAHAPLHGQEGPERWRLVPDLRIGSEHAPEYALSRIGGIAVSEGGDIYVLQPIERTVRVYDPDGRFVRNLGRDGAGPGEFRNPLRIGLHADTLWVLDVGLKRLSFFSLDGRFLRSINFPGLSTERVPLELHQPLSGNDFLAANRITDAPTRQPRGEVLLRIDERGTIKDTVVYAPFNQPSVQVMRPGSSRPVHLPNPLWDAPLWALSPTGGSLFVLERPAPDKPTRSSFQLHEITTRGDTVFSRRYWYRPQPVSKSFLDRTVERLMDGMGFTGSTSESIMRKKIEEALEDLPGFHPPVRGMLITHDAIWLAPQPRIDERPLSLVMDRRTGEIVATVERPAGLGLWWVGRERAWGSGLDELDRPFLVRYRIDRR